MGLKRAFTHNASHRRRSLIKSGIAALSFFVLFTSVTLSLINYQRTRYQQQIETRTQKFTLGYLDHLKQAMQEMMPLIGKSCAAIRSDITSKAAFTSGVRSFLLIKNGDAYCSSATGDVKLPIDHIYPEVDWHKPLDLQLQQGTAMVPEKPAIAMWLRQPGNGNSGVLATLDLSLTPYLLMSSNNDELPGLAIVMGKHAITTFDPNLLPLEQLPKNHVSHLSITQYPLSILFYNRLLTSNDVRLTVLNSLILSLMVGILCYYMLMLSQNPDRALIRGIKRGEFFVEYQPVFHAASTSVAGLEALIRWQHPLEGRIPPDLFIPYAENEELIVPLTRHLFSMIAADAPRLTQVLPRGAKLSLNLSPSHLNAPSFHHDVDEFIAQMPQDYFTLVFEITERGMVEEKNALAEFAWLHNKGVEIAVDDFGTGHSALIYLQRFTLDYLKIDRGFVSAIGQETATAPVLDSVITLAKKLKMLTIAEGVETVEQVGFLQEQGVNFMQGYYFSKPLAIEAFVEFCQANSVFDPHTAVTA